MVGAIIARKICPKLLSLNPSGLKFLGKQIACKNGITVYEKIGTGGERVITSFKGDKFYKTITQNVKKASSEYGETGRMLTTRVENHFNGRIIDYSKFKGMDSIQNPSRLVTEYRRVPANPFDEPIVWRRNVQTKDFGGTNTLRQEVYFNQAEGGRLSSILSFDKRISPNVPISDTAIAQNFLLPNGRAISGYGSSSVVNNFPDSVGTRLVTSYIT